jgi:hypothetical protein
MGVTRTNGIPGLPGNNNFKVMEADAELVLLEAQGRAGPMHRRAADRLDDPGRQVGESRSPNWSRGTPRPRTGWA